MMTKAEAIKKARLYYAKQYAEYQPEFAGGDKLSASDRVALVAFAEIEPLERHKLITNIDQKRVYDRLLNHLRYIDEQADIFNQYTESELQDIVKAVAIINDKGPRGAALYDDFLILLQK